MKITKRKRPDIKGYELSLTEEFKISTIICEDNVSKAIDVEDFAKKKLIDNFYHLYFNIKGIHKIEEARTEILHLPIDTEVKLYLDGLLKDIIELNTSKNYNIPIETISSRNSYAEC